MCRWVCKRSVFCPKVGLYWVCNFAAIGLYGYLGTRPGSLLEALQKVCILSKNRVCIGYVISLKLGNTGCIDIQHLI